MIHIWQWNKGQKYCMNIPLNNKYLRYLSWILMARSWNFEDVPHIFRRI